MSFHRRHAVLLGAATPVGVRTAQMLAEAGVRLCLIGADKDELESLAEALPPSPLGSAITIASAAADRHEAAKLVNVVHQRFDQIDIFISCTDDTPVTPQTTGDELSATTDTKLWPPLAFARELIPIMATQHYGRVVVIDQAKAPSDTWVHAAHNTAADVVMAYLAVQARAHENAGINFGFVSARPDIDEHLDQVEAGMGFPRAADRHDRRLDLVDARHSAARSRVDRLAELGVTLATDGAADTGGHVLAVGLESTWASKH